MPHTCLSSLSIFRLHSSIPFLTSALPITCEFPTVYLDQYDTYVLSCVVIDRFYPRHLHLYALARPTPLFASPPLSPLLSFHYSHTYTTATPQHLCNQFFTRSFHRDGGCTPQRNDVFMNKTKRADSGPTALFPRLFLLPQFPLGADSMYNAFRFRNEFVATLGSTRFQNHAGGGLIS
jgi:hypothetical protein